jgi:hypothetical protein
MDISSRTPIDPAPLRIPKKRRLAWEAYGDLERILQWCLFIIVGLLAVNVVQAALLVSIYRRPPYMLTTDRGYIQYNTTEVYKISSENIFSFLDEVLSGLLNVAPGAYDISSLQGRVSARITKAFAGEDNSAEARELRINRDLRQLFHLYEVRRFESSRYPQYYSIMVRGELTTYERRTDSLGNVLFSPKSEMVYYVVTLDPRRPSPQNPYGLMMVGLKRVDDRAMIEKYWPEGTPLKSFEQVLTETRAQSLQ